MSRRCGLLITRYRPEFKREVGELQRFLRSSDVAANTAYFEWKYERAPYLGEPLVHLAPHSGLAMLDPANWDMRMLCSMHG